MKGHSNFFSLSGSGISLVCGLYGINRRTNSSKCSSTSALRYYYKSYFSTTQYLLTVKQACTLGKPMGACGAWIGATSFCLRIKTRQFESLRKTRWYGLKTLTCPKKRKKMCLSLLIKKSFIFACSAMFLAPRPATDRCYLGRRIEGFDSRVHPTRDLHVWIHHYLRIWDISSLFLLKPGNCVI